MKTNTMADTTDANLVARDVELQLTKPKINAEAVTLIGMAERYLSEARGLRCTTEDEYTHATECFKKYSQAMKQLADIRLTHTRPLDAMKKSIAGFFAIGDTRLTEAKSIAAKTFTEYEQRIAAEQRAEEMRLRKLQEEEQAAQRAEAERIRREAEIEAERERERARAAAEAGRAAEAAELAQAAVEREAQAAHDAMMHESAAEAAAEVVVSAPELKRSAGVSRRVNYSMTVVDLTALVEAWLAGDVPEQCIVADEKFLNARARVDKDSYRIAGTKLIKTEKAAG